MPKVLTVSEFVEAVRTVLRETFLSATVRGEVSGYAKNDNRIFFELKDKRSRLKCFHLEHEVRTRLEDGMEVRVTGTPSLFVGSGVFHLRVTDVEFVGEGALRKVFEETRKRLQAEGLFRPERKRVLPRFPERIGLITSRDGAAYTDVVRILHDRWPLVKATLAHVKVQGSGAVREIVRALEFFSSHGGVDFVILTRGGGSLEDLQAFNDETVARAIFSCRVPVVVGVGHERDDTIADFVADVRASTPSNAAERAVPERTDVLGRIDSLTGHQMRSVVNFLHRYDGEIAGQTQRLHSAVVRRGAELRLLLQRFHGTVQVHSQQARTWAMSAERLRLRMRNAVRHRLELARIQLKKLDGLLHSLSPLAILERGYTITSDAQGKIIKTSTRLAVGQTIHTRFGEGGATSSVNEVI